MIDIEALKQDWWLKAVSHGIDPIEGATGYQVANFKAGKATGQHHIRMSALVRDHAEKHPLNYDNGHGIADNAKVERQARRDWWLYTDYWRLGTPQSDSVVRSTERLAIRAIRDVCKERDTRHEYEVSLRVVIQDLWMQEKQEMRLEATRAAQALDMLYCVV